MCCEHDRVAELLSDLEATIKLFEETADTFWRKICERGCGINAVTRLVQIPLQRVGDKDFQVEPLSGGLRLLGY
ncbi:hypothetical protein D3C71_2093830 [compost metagenome]